MTCFMQDGVRSDVASAPHLVIWGTDVDVNLCKSKFKYFIERFIDSTVEQDEKFEGMDVEQPLYLQRLEEVSLSVTFYYQAVEMPTFVTLHCPWIYLRVTPAAGINRTG
jgi:hypothetical protein